MTKHKTKYRIISVIVIIVAVFLIFRFRNATAALFDTQKAVHIDPDSIENSTLIIGTHLIYLHSLNDEIYSIAQDSASSSGQDMIYYKSELAGGMWLNITDAGSVNDITAAGNIVDSNEIANLYFTHHTKSDGITYDLRTNEKVCIFDIYDVYDLESMPELESLKTQYDIMKESDSKTKTVKRNLELIRKFFAMQIASDVTNKCDTQINALQNYYEELVANGADSKDSEMVLKVMEKVDNARKAAVFTMVDSGLSDLQDAIADVPDDDDETEIDDVLLTAIGNSQYAVSESMSEAEGNMLAKGNTVLSETTYTLSDQMIANAQISYFFSCDEQNKKLQYLDNISNGRIIDRQEELELLDEMIESEDIKYGVQLSRGATEQYSALVSQNVSHAALQNRIKEDMAEPNAAKGELEFFIQARVDRQEKEEAQKYVLERIQDAAKFKVVIKTDDYAQEYQNSVASYTEWLNSLLSSIKENGNSQTEEDSLYEQKADLQEQKLLALDALDLDTAKRIEAKIASVDEKIGAGENAESKVLEELLQKKAELEKEAEANPQDATIQAQLSRVEVEIADSSSSLADNSQAAEIMKKKDEILELLAKGDTSDNSMNLISGDVDVLLSMLGSGSALAQESLKEVYVKLLAKSELEGINGYQDLQESIENAMAESVVNGSLSGELSAKGAESIISEVLGVDSILNEDGTISSDVSSEDTSALLIALGDFSKQTARTAGNNNTQENMSGGSGTDGSGQNGTGGSGQSETGGSGTDGSGQSGTGGSGTDGSGQNGTGGSGQSETGGSGTDGSGQSGTGGSGTDGNGQSGTGGSGTGGNAGSGTDGSGQSGSDGSETDGSGQSGTDGSGTDGSGQSGTDGSGTDGSGQSGTGGSGTDGSGQSGSDGSGTDGSGQSGTGGSGTDGSGQSGSGGSGTGGNAGSTSGTDEKAQDQSSASRSDVSSTQAFTNALAASVSQGIGGYVFQSKKQDKESYVPAKILADYLGYRYVWNDTKKNGILSDRRNYYSFTAFRESVENEKGEIIYMNATAGFMGELYIPGSFVEETFNCYIYDISGTNYSVLVNDKVVEKSQEILSELLEKGGY